MISIVLPVGPRKEDQRWLDECLESIEPQLKGKDEIILIDDMANLPNIYDDSIRIYKNAWRLGCAASWNVGISIAKNDYCLMMGADDWLLPGAVQSAIEEIVKSNDEYGYYSFTIQYYNEYTKIFEEMQSLPCNAAVVNKKLWKYSGGFPPETAVGAPDAAFISILLGNPGKVGYIHKIAEGIPLYVVRRHKDQDTAQRLPYQGVILEVRNILTQTWTPPRWGRFE